MESQSLKRFAKRVGNGALFLLYPFPLIIIFGIVSTTHVLHGKPLGEIIAIDALWVVLPASLIYAMILEARRKSDHDLRRIAKGPGVVQNQPILNYETGPRPKSPAGTFTTILSWLICSSAVLATIWGWYAIVVTVIAAMICIIVAVSWSLFWRVRKRE